MIHGGGTFHDVEVGGLVFTVEILSPGYPAGLRGCLEREEPPTWAVYAIDGRRVGVVGTLLDEVEADEIHAAIRDLVRG